MGRFRIVLPVIVLQILPISTAKTNSWYPQDCGRVDHCAVADEVFLKVKGEAPSELMIFSKHRIAVVQRRFFVGQSKDQDLHVCMRYDPFGDLEVTCLLVPDRPF